MNEINLNEPSECYTDSQEIQKLYNFLKKADEEVNIISNENIVLVLGNTGCGKSTLIQFIAGTEEELTSVEGTGGDFVITDKKNWISNDSTILSQTIFPNILINEKTNTVYYDCPGFNDTRGPHHEIVGAYLLKKILDSAKKVKLIFLVSHHSVRKGGDRSDFLSLLKHSLEFIHNINKYRDGIGLVVTKVENYIKRCGTSYAIAPDEDMIMGISEFLENVKRDVSETELKFLDLCSISSFLETLIFKKDNAHPRIGIFRRPFEAGKLVDDLMITEKMI